MAVVVRLQNNGNVEILNEVQETGSFAIKPDGTLVVAEIIEGCTNLGIGVMHRVLNNKLYIVGEILEGRSLI